MGEMGAVGGEKQISSSNPIAPAKLADSTSRVAPVAELKRANARAVAALSLAPTPPPVPPPLPLLSSDGLSVTRKGG